jgi:hypothetical protein
MVPAVDLTITPAMSPLEPAAALMECAVLRTSNAALAGKFGCFLLSGEKFEL